MQLLAPGAARDPVQLGIHQRHHLVERTLIASAPGGQQPGHFTLGIRLRHFGFEYTNRRVANSVTLAAKLVHLPRDRADYAIATAGWPAPAFRWARYCFSRYLNSLK